METDDTILAKGRADLHSIAGERFLSKSRPLVEVGA